MAPQQLVSASDLVALVRVLTVTCLGVTQLRQECLRSYRAKLGVLKVRKGRLRRFDVISVDWREQPRDIPGYGWVAYRPDGMGWTRLIWRDGEWKPTWWNAADGWEQQGGELPMKWMEERCAPLLTRTLFPIRKWAAALSGHDESTG
jgi:hypothetical protein